LGFPALAARSSFLNGTPGGGTVLPIWALTASNTSPSQGLCSRGPQTAIAVRPPKIEQIALTPVTPSTPIPPPMEWGTDAAWYESWKPPPITDGAVPVEALDTLANPKKTPWYADSFKGPFSCRLWVKVSAAGRIEKVLPIQITDPVLIAYFRHELPTLPMRPARAKGQAADSWNELTMSGTASYSIEVKQILNLRKSLGGSS